MPVKRSLKRRGIYLLPNLLTITALFAGFYAVVAAMQGKFYHAAVAIFIAMLMDGLDGRIARLTNTDTTFGAELDSLSDMVCFGVAPALVAYSWALSPLGKIGWLAAFIYTAAVALRLARYNTQIGQNEKSHFQGLPCPAAAGLIAGAVWFGEHWNLWGSTISWVMALFSIGAGLLMVSNTRYRSFKDIDFKGKIPFFTMLIVVIVLVLVSLNPPEVLFFTFFAYVVSGPMMTLWNLRKRRSQRKAIVRKRKK